MEPRCRHNLSKLRDYILSVDGPAVTAKWVSACTCLACRAVCLSLLERQTAPVFFAPPPLPLSR